ncbi:hypothetical protein ACFPRA_05875 [Sporosarcina soli]|uniref:RNA polymerase subunit sigma n=1 Tax=Sporosarcina soli TaxID=334736 RepID=A0ABW0TIF0_9BACL
MSLKGIELQIAIPKTFDAGKVSEQKLQQSQLNQDLAHALTERQSAKARETVLETKQSARTDGNGKRQGQGESQDGEQRENEEEKKTHHPYKGAFVDFTG